LFESLGVDDALEDEEKELEHVYDKGVTLVDMSMPVGFDDFPTIKMEE
jgi:hypothetical protein